ncbi:MAG: DUF6799 domain-containing protein, partial [Candidatus Saccharimonadales bacterium]
MKKILIAFVAVALSCSAMAQTKMADTSMHKMHGMTNGSMYNMHNVRNSVMMMNGKMMTYMHGKSMPMLHSMTMTNGTMVMPNGMIKMKSGKKMMLKEGYCIKMDGEIQKMQMMKSG